LGWDTEGKDINVSFGNAEPSCSHTDEFIA